MSESTVRRNLALNDGFLTHVKKQLYRLVEVPVSEDVVTGKTVAGESEFDRRLEEAEAGTYYSIHSLDDTTLFGTATSMSEVADWTRVSHPTVSKNPPQPPPGYFPMMPVPFPPIGMFHPYAATVKVAASTAERNVGVSKFRTEANDAKWHANLSQLKPCIKDGGIMDYSSITDDKVKQKLQSFVSTQRQRKYYKMRQENKACSLTDDRHVTTLL